MPAARPPGWDRVPIKNLYLGLFDGPHATPPPADIGPVFLGIKNLTEDGQLDLSQVRHIAEQDFPKWTKRVCPQPGDIVFSYEATLNRYALIPHGFHGCLGRRLALIRPDTGEVDPRFLLRYFFGPAWRRTIAENTNIGSTVDRIPLTNFPDFEVEVPALPTQQKIASILSAYDDLIENNLHRIQILEEMAQLLYREWFVNFRFPGHEKVKVVDSELGKIPEGWVSLAVDELLESSLGGDWGKEEETDKNEARSLVIRGTDLKDIVLGGTVRAPTRWLTATSLEKRRLMPGDVIVENSVNASSRSVGTSLLFTDGMFGYLGPDAICASFCKRFRPNESSLGVLLHLHLKHLRAESMMEYYQNVATNGIANFQAKRFCEDEHLVLPENTALLDRLVGVLQGLCTSIYAERNWILKETRDLLLPRLISGELDVSELEIDVGEDAA